MDPIAQGISLSIAGLLTTFLALGIFIFVIIGLQKIFPYRPEAEEGDEEEAGEVVVASSAEGDDEVVVAIAAALAHLKSSGQGSLGAALENGHGPWWQPSRQGGAMLKGR